MAMSLGIGIGLPFGGGPSSGPSYDPDAAAFFARMATDPGATRKGLYNDLFLALKTGAVSGANIYAKLDAVWLIAAHEQSTAILNLKGTSYTLIPSGTMGTTPPDFTVDLGYLGDGVGKWLDTGIADNAGGINWSRDSMMMGAWVNNNIAGGGNSFGLAANANVRIQPNSGGTQSGRAHTSTSVSLAGAPTRQGFVAVNRSGASAQELYRAGASIATSGASSVAPAASNLSLLLSNTTVWSQDRIAAAVVGGSLTANEHLDLYNALNAYLTAIGGA